MYPTPRRTAGTADTGFDASAAVFAAADRDIGLLVSRDPRSALVYRERILCGRTLDRVGAAMGVTRERVRQLERSLSADLVGLRSVGRALNELKRAHAPFAPPEALTGVPRLRTFAHLAPDWSLTPGGWLVVDGADERVDAALTELSDGASPASVADLSAMLGVRRDVVAGYLECVRRMWLIDGGVLVPPRTVGARAAAILRASPGPMTIAQLSELLGDRPRSSLRNSLARTPGVRRCGADVWTLADRPGDRPVNPATPGETRGMSFIDGHWNLVTDVDGPLLAGAPLVVPHGVAAVTGTPYDVPWRIPGRLGPQSVRWRAQGAAIGPVHRYLADAGAGPGDRVRLVRGGVFDVVPVPATTSRCMWAPVFAELGLGEPGDDPVARLNAALGFPGDRGILRSARRLRRRSQLGLAEAVEQAYRLWA